MQMTDQNNFDFEEYIVRRFNIQVDFIALFIKRKHLIKRKHISTKHKAQRMPIVHNFKLDPVFKLAPLIELRIATSSGVI